MFYVVPPTPVNYLTLSHPHLSPSEHEAGLDVIEDQVNVAPRQRRPQENYQIEQQIVFFSLELQLEGPNLILLELEPPGDVGEDIGDFINQSSPPPSHPPLHTGHQVEVPSLHYLLPPLMYNVDPRDLLPLLPLSFPHIDHEDFPNKPQPVSDRKYQLDLILLESFFQEFSQTSLEGLTGDCCPTSSLPQFLSAQSSPCLPRTVCSDPPLPSPSSCRARELPGLMSPSVPPYQPPGPGLDLPTRDQSSFWLSPPQAVIFAPAQDHINFPSSNIKNYPARLKLSNACSFIRPTAGLVNISVSPSHPSPSPPQSPEFLQRKLSKAEDLFDQVRRHSRGIIFNR